MRGDTELLIWVIFLACIIFIGEPDLHDTIINLMRVKQ